MIAEESDPNSNCHTEDLCALLDQLCDSSICFFKGAKQIYNYWSLFNYPTERDWNIFVAIEISLKFDPEPETCDQMSIHIELIRIGKESVLDPYTRKRHTARQDRFKKGSQ